MAGAILSPVLDVMRRDLGLSDTGAGLVLTVHGFSLAIVAPFIGRAIDCWGSRRTLIWGLTLYGVSGGAGLLIDTHPLLLASRLMFGVGAAAVFTATTVALFDVHRGTMRDRVMGWRASAISLGGFGWPLVGGLLGGLSWHAPFALYLLGVPIAMACAAVLPARPLHPTRPPAHFESPEPAPSAGLRALVRRRPDLLAFYALQFLSAVLLYAALILLPLRLAELRVTAPLHVAVYAATLSAAMTAVGLAYARLRRRLGDTALIAMSLAAWFVGFGVLGVVEQPALLGAPVAIIGLGMGLAVPALTVLVAEAAPAHLRGSATSLSASATFLGQGISPLLLGPVIGATSVPAGFTVAAALAGAVMVIVVATALLRRTAAYASASRSRDAPASAASEAAMPEPRKAENLLVRESRSSE